jgi:hypothetical protein
MGEKLKENSWKFFGRKNVEKPGGHKMHICKLRCFAWSFLEFF